MARLILFILLSSFFLRISWQTLKNPGTHGFYRFFVFEGILILVLLNHPYWFIDPLSPLHLFSWFLLFLSIVFIMQSLMMLKQKGGYAERREMPENFAFENTTSIVKVGLYRYVRHPMYGSLLFLGWGAFFKHINLLNLILVIAVSALLITAAKVEERENVRFFGEAYKDYMLDTKMLIPWLF